MQNPKETNPAQKQNKQTKSKKKKKEGKIKQVWEMNQKGVSIKEISGKMGISEKIVRAYIWRSKNPMEYKALVKRYFAKRKKKTEEKTSMSAEAKQNSDEKA